jgi:hypothetical protein
MTFARELRGGEGAVTVGGHSIGAPLTIGHRRSRGPALEHRQLRDLGVEVDDVGRSPFRFPLGLALSPRIVDIALDMLAGKGRQAEMDVALGMAAVPCALWNDGDHSSAECKRLRRPVVADDFQRCRPVEDVKQLVTGEMAFPMVSPGGFERQKQPVAIGSQSRDASFCFFPRRLRGSSKHCQLRKFRVEIDDAGHSACHFPLPFARRGRLF